MEKVFSEEVVAGRRCRVGETCADTKCTGLCDQSENLLQSVPICIFIFVEILQPVGFGLRPRLHSCQVWIFMP